MAKTDYITLEIDGVKADFDPNGQVPTVSFALEDENDFEKKKSAESFDIEMPATLVNDQIHNSMADPAVQDNTSGKSLETFRPSRYIANGVEILIGKYLQQSVVGPKSNPKKYKGKLYGLNGDWVIDLKEKTLLDFLNPLSHVYSAATIRESWNYDGRNENADFVYAPARYRRPFGNTDADSDGFADDNNCIIEDMRPAISPYWLLYRGLKSVGYRIISTFMDLDYYRRGVLPWTWGEFNFIDSSRWEGLKFLAIQNTPPGELNQKGQPNAPHHIDGGLRIIDSFASFADVKMITDGNIRPGAFDNNGLFSYTPDTSVIPFMMKWDYPTTGPLVLGNVRAGFSVQVRYRYAVSFGSDAEVIAYWYKNGVLQSTEPVYSIEAPIGGSRNALEFKELFFETDVTPGDYVGCRIYISQDNDFLGTTDTETYVEAFQLNYIKLAPGSTVDLKGNYPKFKNYKWMDLLRGEIDLFDLSIQTDPVRKEVYIEPTHAYSINGVKYPGYYNRLQLDWSQKVDYSKDPELELFSDYEREMIFKFQDDTNDGGLKKIQERNQATIGLGKYLLPDRFKTEPKEKANRFYSPLMHRDHVEFKFVTGIAPQLPIIIPENISNTSSPESENTYNPKRAYYKGKVEGVGGWMFEGMNETLLPFMFAVNYKAGGENDPVLSYSDQLIGGVVAQGLMKRFFLQRLAIIRQGRRYDKIFVQLTNYDVANFLHRESIIIENMEYLLTSISNFDPISSDSTGCRMWLFTPKSEVDLAASYPSLSSMQNGDFADSFDVKYWPHLLLTSDI